MHKPLLSIILVFITTFLSGCASSIVGGEAIKLGVTSYPQKAQDYDVALFFPDTPIDRSYSVIGKVVSRAWLLEKGLNELKKQGRKIGAEAIINIKYERKFSVDYLQDLYQIQGDAIVWNEPTKSESR